jgi:hypothetical protein
LPVLFCSVSLSLEQKEAKEKEFYSGDYTRITVRVPKHQHKLIIGAGGKTIREIIKETGAKIKIPPGDEDDEEVVIEGSPEAVDQAAERVTKATMFQERVRTPPSIFTGACSRQQCTKRHTSQDNGGGGGGGGRGRGRPRREEGDEAGGGERGALRLSSLPRAPTEHWADTHIVCVLRGEEVRGGWRQRPWRA